MRESKGAQQRAVKQGGALAAGMYYHLDYKTQAEKLTTYYNNQVDPSAQLVDRERASELLTAAKKSAAVLVKRIAKHRGSASKYTSGGALK